MKRQKLIPGQRVRGVGVWRHKVQIEIKIKEGPVSEYKQTYRVSTNTTPEVSDDRR